jgi:hypothetical protein
MIKNFSNALKSKAKEIGAIMDSIRSIFEGFQTAIENKVKEAEGQAKAEQQQQDNTGLTPEQKQLIMKKVQAKVPESDEHNISDEIARFGVAKSEQELRSLLDAEFEAMESNPNNGSKDSFKRMAAVASEIAQIKGFNWNDSVSTLYNLNALVPGEVTETPPTPKTDGVSAENSEKHEETPETSETSSDNPEDKIKGIVSKAVAAGIDETAASLVAHGDVSGIASALGKFDLDNPEDREQYIALYDNLSKALDFFNLASLKNIPENGIDKFMTPDEVKNKYGDTSSEDEIKNKFDDTQVTPEKIEKVVSTIEGWDPDITLTDKDRKYIDWFLSANDKDSGISSIIEILEKKYKELLNSNESGKLLTFKKYLQMALISADINGLNVEEINAAFPQNRLDLLATKSEDIPSEGEKESTASPEGTPETESKNQNTDESSAKTNETSNAQLFTEEEEDKLANAVYEVKGLKTAFRQEIYKAVTDDGFAEAAKKLYAEHADDENKLNQIHTTLIAMAKSIGKESEVPALPTTEATPETPKEEEQSEIPTENQTPEQTETPITPETPKEEEQAETSGEESNGNDIKRISDSTGLDEGKVESIYKILKDNSTPDDVKRALIIDTIRPIMHMSGFNEDMANKSFATNYANFKKVAEATNMPFEIELPKISEKDINDMHTIVDGTGTDETKLAKIADNLMNSTSNEKKEEGAEGDKEQELLSRITNGPTFAAEVAKAVDAGIPEDYARTVLSSLTMSDGKYSLIKERLKDYDWLNDFKQREAYKKAYNRYNDALLYFTDKGIRDIPELKDELPDPTVEFPNALNDENVMQRVLAQYPVNPETLRKDLEYFNTHIPDENLRYIIKDIIPKYFLENAFPKSFEETVNQIRNDDIKVLNLALINANIAEFKPSPEILKQVTDYINANPEKLKSRMTCTILADALVSGTFDPGMIDSETDSGSPESTPETNAQPASPSNSSAGSRSGAKQQSTATKQGVGTKQSTARPTAAKQGAGPKQQPVRKSVNKPGSGSKQQPTKKPKQGFFGKFFGI